MWLTFCPYVASFQQEIRSDGIFFLRIHVSYRGGISLLSGGRIYIFQVRGSKLVASRMAAMLACVAGKVGPC
jgi:hypothetical protein